MELELTADQEALRSTTARFIASACPVTAVRKLLDSPSGMPDGYLSAAAELGWFAMLGPDELGGGALSENAVVDLAVLAEERGNALQPGPFIPMNVVIDVLTRLGSGAAHSELLAELIAGESTATWAATDERGEWGPGRSVSAVAGDDGWVLEGTIGLVQDAALADWLLVPASGTNGLIQLLVPRVHPGITIQPLDGHDITQRFFSVTFKGVDLPATAIIGEAGTAAGDLDRQLSIAVVLSVAETVGAMGTLFEMTREYALTRTAFGRAIGGFQALKHQLADMSLMLECGKAVLSAAARALGTDAADASEIASIAKLWTSDNGITIAQGCFQVFGGIGFTWEHDLHLFLRRITMNALLYGGAEWHAERICALHGVEAF